MGAPADLMHSAGLSGIIQELRLQISSFQSSKKALARVAPCGSGIKQMLLDPAARPVAVSASRTCIRMLSPQTTTPVTSLSVHCFAKGSFVQESSCFARSAVNAMDRVLQIVQPWFLEAIPRKASTNTSDCGRNRTKQDS